MSWDTVPIDKQYLPEQKMMSGFISEANFISAATTLLHVQE